MNNFFARLSARFRQFMTGRYGSDQLSRFLMGVAVVCIILSFIFPKTVIFTILVYLLLILVYFRMFSRNIQARYNENTRFLLLKDKVLGFFRGRGSRSQGGGYQSYQGYQQNTSTRPKGNVRSDAEHRIFRCPKCDQRVRVPRGRGKIEITCPKCGHAFTRRS